MVTGRRPSTRRTLPPPTSGAGHVRSFEAVAGEQARVLVLGSMPGVASLQAQRYYAHPHNHFWPLMGALFGAGPEQPYEQRLLALKRGGVAVWDVLQSCLRPGSLDAAIDLDSAVPNDLPALLRRYPQITRIGCNGSTAHTLLRRHFGAQLPQEFPQLQIRRLPSSSAANASWSYQRKLDAWRAALID